MIVFFLFLALFITIRSEDNFFKAPVYKYRYETEDVMKTAASNVPVHGYQVVEGGYYPYELVGQGAVGIGNPALQGGIAGGLDVAATGPGIGSALTGPGLGGFGGQYIIKPIGLIGGAGYNGAEFGGAGLGYAGMTSSFLYGSSN